MKKNEKAKNSISEISDKKLEKTSGGSYADGECDKYEGKPGKHIMGDYGHCFACIHDRGDRCDLEK